MGERCCTLICMPRKPTFDFHRRRRVSVAKRKKKKIRRSRSRLKINNATRDGRVSYFRKLSARSSSSCSRSFEKLHSELKNDSSAAIRLRGPRLFLSPPRRSESFRECARGPICILQKLEKKIVFRLRRGKTAGLMSCPGKVAERRTRNTRVFPPSSRSRI